MFIKTVFLTNPQGLPLQKAIELTQLASQFVCDIHIEYKGRKASMKSIIDILSLGLAPGFPVTITTHGLDEYEALQAIGLVFLHKQRRYLDFSASK